MFCECAVPDGSLGSSMDLLVSLTSEWITDSSVQLAFARRDINQAMAYSPTLSLCLGSLVVSRCLTSHQAVSHCRTTLTPLLLSLLSKSEGALLQGRNPGTFTTCWRRLSLQRPQQPQYPCPPLRAQGCQSLPHRPCWEVLPHP